MKIKCKEGNKLMKNRIAVIDLGSNTTRLIIMGYKSQHCFKLIHEVRETVRLAEGIGADGKLRPQPIYRAIEALKMFNALCKATGVEQVVAVATSALREATNQAEFLADVKREAGLTLRVLSAKEEAYYGYLGVVNSLLLNDGFVFDIGGGSTEIAEVQRRFFGRYFSRQAGVVRFTEQFVNSDPINKRDLRALEQATSEIFADLKWLCNGPGQMLVGIGGTVRNLARIDQKRQKYPLDRSHNYILSQEAVEIIFDLLVSNSSQRRKAALPGLKADRVDVILAGTVIIRHLLKKGGFTELVVAGQGLREGVFYEHFLNEYNPPLFPDMRAFSVQSLAEVYEYEAAHAQKVRELSLSLFDQLQPLHGYGAWERELLAYAALLHDIGMQVNYYDHHKHSAYLVMNAALQGFSHREVVILALLVRLHRKGDVDLGEYGVLLQPDEAQRLAKLGSILRISEYLERSKSQVVQKLQVDLDKDPFQIRVFAQGDAMIEVWDANRNTNLLKKAFGREFEAVLA